jgi:hypothetical protein
VTVGAEQLLDGKVIEDIADLDRNSVRTRSITTAPARAALAAKQVLEACFFDRSAVTFNLDLRVTKCAKDYLLAEPSSDQRCTLDVFSHPSRVHHLSDAT